ncbi:hypothetical protein ACFYT3_22905 [Nocardia amikacinitolerans]|uniref:hypothetical protein n=1 Tax=Nocardia amikacinitolerans TaxID=756689 RepID=UPI0020A262D2|nr:hypothetical protein [Nocardia amikacinitolerans]
MSAHGVERTIAALLWPAPGRSQLAPRRQPVAVGRDGATVVVIGHRPSVLAAADHVVPVRASVFDGVGGS